MVAFLFSTEIRFVATEGVNSTGFFVPLALLMAVICIAFASRGIQGGHFRRGKSVTLSHLVFQAPPLENGLSKKAAGILAGISKPSSPSIKAMERRTSFRRKGNPLPILISDASGNAPPKEGTVLDRSLGGLLISAPDFAKVGITLSVRPKNASEDISWIQIDVRHCQKKQGRWLLGCAFSQKLASCEGLIFG
jgi:hypothetical protein